MPITKTDVEGLNENSIIWDTGRGSVAGFGVRRQRTHPVFVLKYRTSGRQRWYSIGRYGSPWSVELARKEAKRLLGQIVEGKDPAVKQQLKQPDGPPRTVAALCDEYMRAAKAGAVLTRFNRPKKASTLAIDVGRIERHIKPLIGNLFLSEVDSRVIRDMIDGITQGKTAADIKTGLRGRARVSGGAGTAARVADLLSGIMSWAGDQALIEKNPVHRVRRYRSQPRNRFLTPEELARLGKVLHDGKDCQGRAIHPYALLITTLLALTGCRMSEIAGIRWVELDLAQKCLRLDDTKTGRSLRAIGAAAVNCFRKVDRVQDGVYVFPASRAGGAYQGMKKEARRIFTAAALPDVTSHVLRHTFASVASELGYSDATIAGLLGHRGRGVTSRYVHRPDGALISAADAVSSAVYSMMSLK